MLSFLGVVVERKESWHLETCYQVEIRQIRIGGCGAECKFLTRFPVEHGQWFSKSKEKG